MAFKYIKILLLSMIASAALNANATLIGDTVTAQLSNPANNDASFNLNLGSAIVGTGVEFSGTNTDVFGQIWDTLVDVDASSFTISWTERTRAGSGNIFDGNDFIRLTLSDLDWINGPGSITGVSLASAAVTLDRNTAINFTSDSVIVDFSGLYHGDSYTFDITTSHDVPEPTTLALMVLGLVGLGFRRRKLNT